MCWQQLPGLIVTGRSTIGADACGLLSASIAKLSSHSWGNTRSRIHDGLGAGIRDAWIVGKQEVIRLVPYCRLIIREARFIPASRSRSCYEDMLRFLSYLHVSPNRLA